MYSEDDKKAAWLILQLAEQGRFEEITAQMIASLLIVMGGDPFVEYTHMLGKINNRLGELLQDDGAQIWQHLVPGGHQGDPLPWVVRDNRDFATVEVQVIADYESGWLVLDKNNNLWFLEATRINSTSNPHTKVGGIVKVLREDLNAANYKDIHELMGRP